MNNCYEEKWLALKEEIDRRGADGEAVTAALRDYYSIFEDRAVEWLGSLYNPEVGGFHFATSSRENDTVTTPAGRFDLLPDIESSFQVLSILADSKTIEDFSELPEKMREGLIKFTCSLQDEADGFIYHPQWRMLMQDGFGKDDHADKIWRARRGRDMNWAEGMTKRLGFKLPYPTAYERLAATDDGGKNDALPDYLQSKDAFIEHLDSLDWENDAYYAGNMIAAQARLIKAAGLVDTAVEYISARQDPETGLWGNKTGYAAINGYLKTSAIYMECERPIPNADKAALSVIKCATTSEPALTACYQYNVWYSLLNIITNIRTHGGERGEEMAREISLSILKSCTEAIRVTKEKTLTFKKPDGAFSSYTYGTADHSMGMPVAIKGIKESDTNGTNLCSTGTVKRMFTVLGLEDFYIPLYSPEAFKKFLKAAKM